MSPVEEIREAARLMRERAQAALEIGWWARRNVEFGYPSSIEDHVGSWHPTAALAVADWLADVATDLDEDLWPDGHDVPRNALAVARAFLGANDV